MGWGRWIVHAKDTSGSGTPADCHRFEDYHDLDEARQSLFEWRLSGWDVKIIDTHNLQDEGLNQEMVDRFREIIATMDGEWTARWQS